MSDITAKRDHKEFKIYVHNLLHLQILMNNHDGMQSWIEGNGKEIYHIELYRREGAAIHLEYEDKGTWIDILNLIDTNL